MCTVFVAFKALDDFPLLVAANRDERLDRPSSGLKLWDGAVRFLAPVDDEAHGTWIGLNERGVLVAVTNRYLAGRDASRRSRGALVTDALRARSAKEIHEQLRALTATTYNAFHLFYADVNDAFVSWSDDEKITHERLAPGTHIFTERSFAAEPASRSARLQKMWSELPTKTDALSVFELLRVHADEDPFSGACIHAPAFNYGTRSSTVWQISPRLSQSALLSSEGPACTANPRDFSELVRSLAR